LQGVPSQTYRISLSKNDYEDVQTYPNFPESSFIPINSDLYVSSGALNSKNFFIDLTSDLTFKTVNALDGEPVPNVDIELIGGKEIGSSPTTYNFEETSSTGSDGEIRYENISPGFYQIINIDDLETGDYVFVGSKSEATFNLEAGDDLETELFFADKNIPSLQIIVSDNITEEPIKAAIVSLVRIPSEFYQSIETQEDGTVFFPLKVDPLIPMENETYEVEIKVNGYEDYIGTVDIDNLTTKTIKLNPLE